MTIIDFLNENTFIAWIVAGIFAFIVVIYFLRIYLKKLFKKIEKTKKEKLKADKLTKVIYKDRVLNSDLISIKDFDKQKFYYQADDRNYFSDSKGFIRRYFDRRKRRKHPDKVVLIRMEMNNGQYKEFIVIEDDKNGFKHGGKKYIFDLDAKYYVLDSNIWAYDYHESLVLPVKRTIPVNRIKSLMEHSNITEVENAINPITLERFIKSEIAQGILQGATIGKLFKVILILLIITMIVSGVDFIVDMFDSGILQDLIAKK